MVSRAINTAYSTGGGANGLWRAIVQAVNDNSLNVTIPRLGQSNVYENVPYIGFTPQVGDRIWVGFIEGRSFEPVAFVGATDTSTDITEIVAGTNLNGGGTGGSITVNLDDDITLSTVTADGFYGDLYGAIHILVKNVSGGSLTKGTPVYATGAVGASGAVEVEASLAGTGSTMPAMGLLDQDLANNGEGDVVVSGVLQNIDTDTPGYSVGDELYVAPSGGLTTTRPTGSSELVQKIGKVIRVQQQTGEILVQGAGRTNDVPNSFSITGDMTVGGDATVTGDLTVNGTTVTLNTETLTVEDNIIVLNSNVSGAPSLDAGIEVERGTSANVSFLWDESNDRWTLGSESLVAGTFIGGVEATTITASGDVSIDTDTLFVDASTDRVGIGTTSPAEELHIQKDQNGDLTQILVENIDQRVRIGSYYEGGVGQYAKIQSENDAGTDLALALNPEGGNVGIGTTSPTHTLTVDGNTMITANQSYYINSENSGVGRLRLHWASSTGHAYVDYKDDLNFRANGTGGAVTFKADGKVGIGTTSVTAGHKVEIHGALLVSSTTGVGNSHFPYTDGRFYYTADPETGGTGDHVFRHYSGGSYVEQMRILEGGKVGIGTNSPVAGLDIATTAGDQWTTNGWDSGLIVNDASALRWRSSSGTNYGIGTSSGTLFFMSSTSSTTGAAANYRMVINSSGQVGINTTAPTSGYELDVVGDGRFSSSVYAQLHNSNSNQSRDKLRVWNSSTYSIGMKSGYSFGYLGGVSTGTDYAMSFQMSNSNNRGFWWGDSSHSDAQGAMSLTTQGQLYVATRIHVGGGESRTDPSTSYNLVNSGSTYLYGNVVLGTLPGVSGYYTVRRRNSDGLLGYASSSQRYKENIIDADDTWRQIYSLRPRDFDWRESMFDGDPNGVPSDRSDYGLIAEEANAVMPSIVQWATPPGETDPVIEAIDYEKLSTYLLPAIQDLNARLAALEAQ